MKEPKNEVSRWSIFEDEMAPIPRVFDVAQEAGGNSRQIRDIRIFNRPKSGRDTRLAQPFCPLSPPTVIGSGGLTPRRSSPRRFRWDPPPHSASESLPRAPRRRTPFILPPSFLPAIPQHHSFHRLQNGCTTTPSSTRCTSPPGRCVYHALYLLYSRASSLSVHSCAISARA